MKPIVTRFQYTYKKPNTDVWVLNTKDIPLDFSKTKDQQIVHIAPQNVGGNHKHKRIEWFIALGELELVWLDEQGEKHTEAMFHEGEMTLIEIPSFLPHAVKNPSTTTAIILFEYGDDVMKDPEIVRVI